LKNNGNSLSFAQPLKIVIENGNNILYYDYFPY